MQTNPQAKRILCYGDSNTRWRVPLWMGTKRFDSNTRWTGILQKNLGDTYEIIEEWLWGRTTMFDDPRSDFPERNGAKTLPIILESHLPLDYVIIMLGTTDTKEMMHISSEETTEGIKKLIHIVKWYKVLEGTQSPKIILIVPPIVQETANFASKLFIGATAKMIAFKKTYSELAKKEDIYCIDCTDEILVDREDGVHIDATQHKKLAALIFPYIIM